MIDRLLELFEGPEAPGPWAPPAMPAALHALLPWRAFDEASELYVNAGSVGFVVELPPFAGIDAETLGALAGTLADAAPERCTVQVVHWASPRFGAAARAWAGAACGCRRRARPDGVAAPRPARPRRLAPPASRAGRPSPCPTTGCSSPPASRADRVRRPAVETRARRVPPRAGGHAGLGRRTARAGWSRTRCCRWRPSSPRRTSQASATAEPSGRLRRWAPRDPLARAVHRPRPRAQRSHPTGLTFHHAPGTAVRRERRVRRGHRCAGAQRHRLSGGLAGLARQRADRRLPPRLPPARLPGADLPHRRHRRRGGRREGVPQVRPRDATGRHRHREVPPRPAREGARLAGGDRPDQGRREAGPRLLHGRGLRPARRARRGRTGGARDLPRPGLAGERRALHAAPILARLSADGVRRRPRRRPRTHGADEDPADVVGGQPRALAWRVAGPGRRAPRGQRAPRVRQPRQPARPVPDRAPGPAGLLVALRQRGRQLQRGRHRQVRLGQVGADAGAGDRADRRRRRGRGDRRRALLPAHGGSPGRARSSPSARTRPASTPSP